MGKRLTVSLYSFGCYTELTDNFELYHAFQELLSINNEELLVRLYKKYVKRENVDKTVDLLKAGVSRMKGKNKKIFDSLLFAFEDGVEGSEISLRSFGKYEPLRLVVLDEPYCMLSDNISLEDYDNNDGEPFWMRPEYIIEKYSKVKKI